jgi:hypothetical protein
MDGLAVRQCTTLEGDLMANLGGIVKHLRLERVRAVHEVKRLNDAIAALSKLSRNTLGAYAKKFGRKKRTMSAAARRRISLAQKARWAKVKTREQKKAA